MCESRVKAAPTGLPADLEEHDVLGFLADLLHGQATPAAPVVRPVSP